MFNQIAVHVAAQLGSGGLELARLLALVNVGMADAAIACWGEKYAYQYWRPVTAIREADPRTGPTGAGDHNPLTRGDPDFTPLGAPASNTQGLPNFTPPFPAYASRHATPFFQTLRRFFRTDAVAFTFVSDELNGRTRDVNGAVRPLAPRSFSSFSEAEREAAMSRIWLGVHWSFDATQGIAVGRRVADHVLAGALRPSSCPWRGRSSALARRRAASGQATPWGHARMVRVQLASPRRRNPPKNGPARGPR